MVSFITIIDREIAAMSDKKFKVSAEKFGIVTVNLESRSWINSQDSHFDLYWSNLSQTDFQSVIVNEAIVNHFRGSQNLSNKVVYMSVMK